MIKIDKKEIKNIFVEGKELFKISLYKNIIFQIIFKILYVTIIIFLIRSILRMSYFVINILESQKIPILDLIISILKFQSFLNILIAGTMILFVYYVEKNGQILILGNYYQNKNISMFSVLKKAIRKVPKIIVIKIKELSDYKYHFYLVILIWILVLIILVRQKFFYWLGMSMILSLVILGLIIYFRRIYLTYIVCLHSKESAIDFNKKVSKKSLRLKTYVATIYYFLTYSILIILILFLLLFMNLIIKMAGKISDLILAQMLSFFVIIGTIILFTSLIFISSGVRSLYTILYFRERKILKLKTKIYKKENVKDPFNSVKMKKYFFPIVFLIIILIYIFLSTIIYSQIKVNQNNVVYMNNNDTENFSNSNSNLSQFNISENITSEKLIKYIFLNDNETNISIFEIVLYLKDLSLQKYPIENINN